MHSRTIKYFYKKHFMKRILLLLALASFIGSWAQKKETISGTASMSEVMGLHDEVMEEMPKTAKLIWKLEAESKKTKDPAPYTDAINKLKSSNKSMSSWMEGFGRRFNADEMMKGKKLTNQKQIWLNEEKQKIVALRKQIYSSIKQAEDLLAAE